MGNHLRGSARRKWLRHEILETRSMLAGDVSVYQHPLDPHDLNDDGVVSAADALVAINTINAGFTGELAAKFAPPTLAGVVEGAAAEFLDATGDGHLSAGDALAVVNTINARLAGGPLRDLPTEDQHGDSPTDTDPAIGNLDLTRGFARTRAVINSASDVDVFKIEPTKENLHVTLFSARRIALRVTLATVVAGEDNGVDEVATAETEAGTRGPAKINFDVTPGTTYFILVQHVDPPDPDAPVDEVIAPYVLGALNYSDDQFRPVLDSELGDDQHGSTAETATALALRGGVHALVRSNIDAAGDVDSFIVEAKDGKLIVQAGAEFDLNIDVVALNAEGQPTGTPVTGERRVILSVTAGKYMVSVSAADEVATGPYRLNIVNPPIRRGIPHDVPTGIEAIFEHLDKDDDNAVSKEELAARIPLDKIPVLDQIFNNWDADGNGELDFAEFEAKWETLHQRAPVLEPVREFLGRLRGR